MKKIKKLCQNRSLTLHRAFDVCKDPLKVLTQCEKIGINTILTSGQKNCCVDGIELIENLLNSKNSDIEILVGGGVNSETIKLIHNKVPIRSFHMSGKTLVESRMKYRNNVVSMGLNEMSEYTKYITDEKQVSDAFNILKSFYAK